ncbi:MAG: hypothetical protein QM610_02485 [Chitinophagaceae bacterium]
MGQNKFFTIVVVSILMLNKLYSQRKPSHVESIKIVKHPSSMKKISMDSLNLLSKNGAVKIYGHDFKDSYYTNGVLIYSMISTASPADKKDLAGIQKSVIGMLRWSPNIYIIDTSFIDIINNKSFLYIGYHKENKWYIRFYSDYTDDEKYLFGYAEFDHSRENEAWRFLRDYLSGVQFINH